MAEYQIAVPLEISGLLPSPQLIASIISLSKLYVNNLVDLKELDPQCASKLGEELVKLIRYHRIEALKPAEIVCQNLKDTAAMSANMKELDIHLQDIWDAYNAQTMREFDESPEYISCKSTMELLLGVIPETQKIVNLDQLKPFISSTIAKGGLVSFTDHPKDPLDSGIPTVLFISESPQKDGIGFITGASQIKLRGYPQLELIMNNSRASRFTGDEVDAIQGKIRENRATMRRYRTGNGSTQTMNKEFEKLASSYKVKIDLIEQRRILKQNTAIKIAHIRPSSESLDEATHKDKIAEIQDIRRDAKNQQIFIGKQLRNSEKAINNAISELEGAARKTTRELAPPEDYWDHSEERGMSLLPNGLREVNPCWSCYSLYRFDQKIDPSGILWNTPDNEENASAVGVCAEAVAHVQSQRRPKECEE